MAVTFNNAQYVGAEASTGAITDLPLTGFTYTGTSLTGAVGATAVTLDGTIDQPGSTVTVNLQAAGLVAVNAQGTYLGYSNLGNNHYEYYFSVVAVDTTTNVAAAVTVGVSSTDLPAAQALVPVNGIRRRSQWPQDLRIYRIVPEVAATVSQFSSCIYDRRTGLRP